MIDNDATYLDSFGVKHVPKEIKGAPSCLRQFLAIESPLKITKNAFELFSFLRYLNFLS